MLLEWSPLDALGHTWVLRYGRFPEPLGYVSFNGCMWTGKVFYRNVVRFVPPNMNVHMIADDVETSAKYLLGL